MDKTKSTSLQDTKETDFHILFKKKYGFIKRARASFLYTEKNIRLVDLAQNEGRAILGWRHGSSMLAFKNTLEKGLWTSYPSGADQRLIKAIKMLFSLCGFSDFRFFSWFQSFPKAFFKNDVPLVYPWSGLSPLQDNDPKRKLIQNENSFVFIPPFPWPSLYIIASKTEIPLPQDPLSTSLMEALIRSIYDLIKEFPKRSMEEWGKFDLVLSPYFIREGSLLKPKMTGREYDAFALHCLESEIYIAPRTSEFEAAPPSFVPWFAERSAFKKL